MAGCVSVYISTPLPLEAVSAFPVAGVPTCLAGAPASPGDVGDFFRPEQIGDFVRDFPASWIVIVVLMHFVHVWNWLINKINMIDNIFLYYDRFLYRHEGGLI